MCVHNCKYIHKSVSFLHIDWCWHKDNRGNYCCIDKCPIIEDVLKKVREKYPSKE